MKNVLKYLIEQSLDCLYANDKDLLVRKVAERDITHRFAHYFENNIAGTIVAEYNVDCEYNRDGYGIKQVNGNYVYPDFILHKRGCNDNNILIIEFKTWWNSENNADIDKIKWMMNPQLRYGYKFGCSIVLNKKSADIQWIEI